MIPKLQIKQETQLSLSKLETLISSIGLDSKDSYSDEEYQQILDAATRPQPQRPVKKDALTKAQAPVSGGIQQTQHIVQARHNRGAAMGAKAAIAELEGFTQTYTGITGAFYDKFSQLSETQSQEAESFEVAAVEVDVDDFLSHFFDAEAIAALPPGLSN